MENPFLRKLMGFATLSPGDIEALETAMSKPQRYAARKDIIREGDEPGPVLVVLDGWAYRYKILPNGSRQVLAFLMPGDACDLHIGLLDAMDHNIGTLSGSSIAAIGRVDMDHLMDARPSVAKAMYVAQLVDEGTMRAWITSLGRRASIERVAHLMCELYLRASNIGIAADDKLTLPVSQNLLADALGMTPVHINRVLKKLRLMGAMTLDRSRLVVTDPGKLATVAGFDDNYLHRRLRRAAA